MAPYTRQAKSTGLWSAQYRDATGRKRYTGGHRSKKEAERAAVIEEDRERRGRYRDPRSHRLRYAEWAETWWKTRGVEDSTLRSDRPRMDNHVLPRWGGVRLGEIARLDVQAWVLTLVREPQAPRHRPLSASTARKCYYLLKLSLDAAVAENIIEVNPCRQIRLPELPIADENFLADDQVDELFGHLDGFARLFAELLVDTGLRPGEACALHRHRVHLEDPDDPYLEVMEAYDHDAGIMRPHPKGKRRRQVPLSFDMAGWLQRWFDAHPDPGSCGVPHEEGRCRSGLAITTDAGYAIHRGNFVNRQWAQAVLSSGISASPYDLRHTFASRAITAGIPLERLQVLMGHVSFQTTLRYARLMDDGRAAVRAAFAGRAEAARGRPDDGAGRPESVEPTTVHGF